MSKSQASSGCPGVQIPYRVYNTNTRYIYIYITGGQD